ncbi:MAG: rod shape-determining protein MreD [Clostridia bacterium]|nr:rod shape-determining protein MreD [Clostridia bacterium]
MKTTLHGAFLLAFSIFQATLIDCIEIFSVKPNLFLIYVIIVCTFCGKSEGAVLGAFFGLVLDLLVGRLWGLNAILMMLLGFFTAYFCERVLRDNNILVVLLMVLAETVLYEIVYGFIYYLTLDGGNFFAILLRIIIPEGFYNMIVTIPVYFIVRRMGKVLYSDKGETIG